MSDIAIAAAIQLDTTTAAAQLVDTLKTAGVAEGDNLQAFGVQFGPEFARIAALLGVAKAVGDTINQSRYEMDLDCLTIGALEAAAAASIRIESAEETTLENVLSGFADVLVAAAIKAV